MSNDELIKELENARDTLDIGDLENRITEIINKIKNKDDNELKYTFILKDNCDCYYTDIVKVKDESIYLKFVEELNKLKSDEKTMSSYIYNDVINILKKCIK